jgi:hypothetical protein
MKILSILLAVVWLGGCTIVAPKYTANVDNVNVLKQNKQEINTGDFVLANKKLNSISLRGSKLKSPVNASYADYLEDAIQLELTKASLFNPLSPLLLTAKITENDLDASGFSVGDGIMTVEFTVSKNRDTVFNKTLTAKIEWDSSFIGSIAIPNAQNSYPKLVKQLLSQLYSDAEFKKLMM